MEKLNLSILSSDPDAFVCQMTPQKAGEIFSTRNPNNRNVNKGVVDRIVADIKSGNWQSNNGSYISFDKDGNLLDGQHRLLAIAEAGIPVMVRVKLNADRESADTIDCGRSRSLGDVFKMSGIKNATSMASMLRKYNCLRSGCVIAYLGGGRETTDRAVSNREFEILLARNERIYSQTLEKALSFKSKPRLVELSTIAAYMSYLIIDKGHSAAQVFAFWSELLDQSLPNRHSSCCLLNERLSNDKISRTKLTGKSKEQLIKAAWRAYVEHREIGRLVPSEDKDFV